MHLAQSIINTGAAGVAPVIAEIKRLIPKLATESNLPRDTRDAGILAKCYAHGGAAGISLVTERRHFGGSPEQDIPAVLEATTLPLLIKDFIVDRTGVQYYAALLHRLGHGEQGRVTLLLIAHRLRESLPAMLDHVRRCGMEALVEIRGIRDLPYLRGIGRQVKMIGFNNKNIDNLEKGTDTLQLTSGVAAAFRRETGGGLLISQSAHRTPVDVLLSLANGADAVLAGTAFMLSPEPAGTVASFVRAPLSRRKSS